MRHILAQVRRRPWRAVALLLTVLVATSGFIVLTANINAARLTVVGTATENSRAAYQILVRPPGTRDPQELASGLLRPNFLSGQYGGISFRQWETIRSLPGVGAAAPIAMLGYITSSLHATVDITADIDPNLRRQILRVDPYWRADRGLTVGQDKLSAFVYVTRHEVLWPRNQGIGSTPAFPGATATCAANDPAPYEVQDDGSRVPICVGGSLVDPKTGQTQRVFDSLVQVLPDGRYVGDGRPATDTIEINAVIPTVTLVAAIDPAQESALVGLDHAIVSGRYLVPGQATVGASGPDGSPIEASPVLLASNTGLDEQFVAKIGRIDVTSAPSIVDRTTMAGRGTVAVSEHSVDVDALYRQRGTEGINLNLAYAMQIGAPTYESSGDGARSAKKQPSAAEVWKSQAFLATEFMPFLNHDTGVRPLTPTTLTGVDNAGLTTPVGLFDPTKVTSFDALAAVPLETYAAAAATGADPETTKLLGGRALLPNNNVGGYLSAAPTVLVSLDSVQRRMLPDIDNLISAVRVRVAGTETFDDVSRERVRVLADQIHAQTGLEVDVLFGSSPAPQRIDLPAGDFGRPALRLTEPWSKLGVAATIINAADRKSVLLFALILIVCTLFLANAVSAAVHDRRRDLAILVCLGWTRGRVAGVVLGEAGVIGLVGGVIGAAVSIPLGALTGSPVSGARAAITPVIALLLALAAASVPALRASRTHPAAALAPIVAPPSRARRHRRLLSLALVNVARRPGRTTLAVAGLGLGIAALTLLTIVQITFRGTVVGSLLGDAVAVQVRTVDLVAAIATVLLGVVVVVDVVYLNIRERASELATLQAMGWSTGALTRLVSYECATIGVIGAGAGATVGALGAVLLIAPTAGGGAALAAALAPVLALALVCGVVGIALATLAGIVPALLQQRLSTAALLAEE